MTLRVMDYVTALCTAFSVCGIEVKTWWTCSTQNELCGSFHIRSNSNVHQFHCVFVNVNEIAILTPQRQHLKTPIEGSVLICKYKN